jgi:hypothetical protein
MVRPQRQTARGRAAMMHETLHQLTWMHAILPYLSRLASPLLFLSRSIFLDISHPASPCRLTATETSSSTFLTPSWLSASSLWRQWWSRSVVRPHLRAVDAHACVSWWLLDVHLWMNLVCIHICVNKWSVMGRGGVRELYAAVSRTGVILISSMPLTCDCALICCVLVFKCSNVLILSCVCLCCRLCRSRCEGRNGGAWHSQKTRRWREQEQEEHWGRQPRWVIRRWWNHLPSSCSH